MSIEFKENAVCYAGERFWSVTESYDDCLVDCDGVVVRVKYLIECADFQLNEPMTGDYLQKSELDTEQKYNDAVEELGLFGFEPLFRNFNDCSQANNLYFINESGTFIGGGHSDENLEVELTYNQLMAIGKLKRLMNERKSSAVSKVNQDIEKAVKSTINAELDKSKLATQYLNECIQVQRQRGEQYDSNGTGERSFYAAAKAYNALTGQNLKGSDVCLLLTCVKAVRQYSNPNRLHEDSLLDMVSYASLWAEELNKEINNG